jgi:hypothetical protein
VLGGPIAALLHQWTGSWTPVFAVIITMDFTTAALAIFALKPLRKRWLQQHVTFEHGEHGALATEDAKAVVRLAPDGGPA